MAGDGDPMIVMATALLGVAVVLIRLGWGGRGKLAGAGWIVATVALGWLGATEGAWGLAVGLTAGSIFAIVAVLYAGATAPRRPARRAAAEPAVQLSSGPNGLLRRLLVFLAVVPLSFLAAQWLAFAINTAMKGAGSLEANSVATMLFVQPVAWSILMAWQMTLTGPARMLLPPALVASAGGLLWLMA
jgi:hypothetical protein